MAIDAITFAAAKKYTEKTVRGMGAIKGAPCTVDGVRFDQDGNTVVTLGWTDNAGQKHTSDITLQRGQKGEPGKDGSDGRDGINGLNGSDGVSVVSLENIDGRLICTMSDGQEIDAGELPRGDTGEPGEKGEPGEAATINIGTVTQGEIAKVENVGTAQNAVFDITLPRGEKGEDAIAAINPRGAWAESVSYEVNDYITAANGNTYVCSKSHTSSQDNEPPTPEFWQLIALQGAPGRPGEPGAVPVVNVSASVDGTPIEVEKTGTEAAPSFDLKFDGKTFKSQVSKEEGNAIEEKPDGIYVTKAAEVIIDPDETNAIEKKATGLYAKNLKPEIDELKLFKTPNATPTGTPAVNNGHISGFSANDYYHFPFLVDFKGRHFQIDAEFTTSDDVATQQNIFDSDFGFAFAIRSGKFVIAMSSNGTAWNIGEGVGTHNVQANATYRVRLSWDGSVYKVEFSTDGGQVYNVDIEKASAESLYPRQIYIGVGENFGSVLNFFKGSINFNNCSLTIANELVWQGMDSAGIASRLATDVSNIDAAGEKKIKDIVGLEVREVEGSIIDYIPKATTEQYGLVKLDEPIVRDISSLFAPANITLQATNSYIRFIKYGRLCVVSAYRCLVTNTAQTLTTSIDFKAAGLPVPIYTLKSPIFKASNIVGDIMLRGGIDNKGVQTRFQSAQTSSEIGFDVMYICE